MAGGKGREGGGGKERKMGGSTGWREVSCSPSEDKEQVNDGAEAGTA